MNNIVEAREKTENGSHTAKRLECLIATDNCSLIAAENKFKFGAGEITVIPPKTEYSFEGEAIYLALDRYTLPFKKVTIVPDDERLGLKFTAEQAVKYFESRESLLLSALGELIAAYLITFAPNKELSPIVQTVRDEIYKNVSNGSFALDAYLNSLPLNGEYIRKLFKKETGVTPHKLLLDERMKLAEYLLSGGAANQYSEYSVSQVAEACGISEPLYFSRVFKQYFGVAPSKFKK